MPLPRCPRQARPGPLASRSRYGAVFLGKLLSGPPRTACISPSITGGDPPSSSLPPRPGLMPWTLDSPAWTWLASPHPHNWGPLMIQGHGTPSWPVPRPASAGPRRRASALPLPIEIDAANEPLAGDEDDWRRAKASRVSRSRRLERPRRPSLSTGHDSGHCSDGQCACAGLAGGHSLSPAVTSPVQQGTLDGGVDGEAALGWATAIGASDDLVRNVLVVSNRRNQIR